MSETWYLPVCPGCRSDEGTNDAEHWAYHRAFRDRGIAELKAAYHNSQNHDGEDVCEVVEFESEAVGSLPRDQPSKEELVA